MKLTCVTATFNCIKAGIRDKLIRCVESVAKLKTAHEHLVYDGVAMGWSLQTTLDNEVNEKREINELDRRA